MTDRTMFTIGRLKRRSGVAASAIRFYENQGLITSQRNTSGHRCFAPDALRRVAFIRTAQKVGLSLEEIRAALDSLPDARTPTNDDWAELAASWRPVLDERIAELQRLRDNLDGCIGCGCLSMNSCAIWNPGDVAASLGDGPRYVLSDERPAEAGRGSNG